MVFAIVLLVERIFEVVLSDALTVRVFLQVLERLVLWSVCQSRFVVLFRRCDRMYLNLLEWREKMSQSPR